MSVMTVSAILQPYRYCVICLVWHIVQHSQSFRVSSSGDAPTVPRLSAELLVEVVDVERQPVRLAPGGVGAEIDRRDGPGSSCLTPGISAVEAFRVEAAGHLVDEVLHPAPGHIAGREDIATRPGGERDGVLREDGVGRHHDERAAAQLV